MDPSGVKVLETAEDIQERRQQVLDRYHRFKELSSLRRQKLEDSYRFQFFQRDADELEKWIQEKLQIASDENYKDPSNLQASPTAILCSTANIRAYQVNWNRQNKSRNVAWSESGEERWMQMHAALQSILQKPSFFADIIGIFLIMGYMLDQSRKCCSVQCSVKPAGSNPRICWAFWLCK